MFAWIIYSSTFILIFFWQLFIISKIFWHIEKWDKIFKNGPSKICGKQPLKNLKWYGLLHITSFLKAVFQKFYLVHSWIPWPKCFEISRGINTILICIIHWNRNCFFWKGLNNWNLSVFFQLFAIIENWFWLKP